MKKYLNSLEWPDCEKVQEIQPKLEMWKDPRGNFFRALRVRLGRFSNLSLGRNGAHLEFSFGATRGAPRIFFRGGTGRRLFLRPDTQKKNAEFPPQGRPEVFFRVPRAPRRFFAAPQGSPKESLYFAFSVKKQNSVAPTNSSGGAEV